MNSEKCPASKTPKSWPPLMEFPAPLTAVFTGER